MRAADVCANGGCTGARFASACGLSGCGVSLMFLLLPNEKARARRAVTLNRGWRIRAARVPVQSVAAGLWLMSSAYAHPVGGLARSARTSAASAARARLAHSDGPPIHPQSSADSVGSQQSPFSINTVMHLRHS